MASVPSAFVFGRGGLGHVDGLLQRPPQVDGPLLDHLPDVFDPVLLVLDAGRLWAGTDAVRPALGPASPAFPHGPLTSLRTLLGSTARV